MSENENPSPIAFVVVEPSYENSNLERVYLNREEAEAFVDAYQAGCGGYLEIEEVPLGTPRGFDGPVYECTWYTRRKQQNERQLIFVTEDGLTTVVPSAVPTQSGFRYFEMFAPSWANVECPVKYEEPPVWIDSFHTRTEWHTGDTPPEAEVTTRSDRQIRVRGSSKEAVEQLAREAAREAKTHLV